jgi:hypothetical protein
VAGVKHHLLCVRCPTGARAMQGCAERLVMLIGYRHNDTQLEWKCCCPQRSWGWFLSVGTFLVSDIISSQQLAVTSSGGRLHVGPVCAWHGSNGSTMMLAQVMHSCTC